MPRLHFSTRAARIRVAWNVLLAALLLLEAPGRGQSIQSPLSSADIRITEFLASNLGGLEDEDGDSPDWIEILNDGSEPVDLEGWSLTDDLRLLAVWEFPSIVLDAGEYLVVFASGKDRRPAAGGELHADFRLEQDGEFLALLRPAEPGSAPEVASAFSPSYPPQRGNVSYGYGSAGNVGYIPVPTPGEPNGEAFPGFVETPTLSARRGYYDAPFDVEIACATPGAVIRYTVDGSAPSGTRGKVYGGPVTIDGTTPLRAFAYRTGLISSPVETHTYIFLDQVLRQNGAGFPSAWGSVSADYAMDPDVVNGSRYRDTIRDDLLSLPAISIAVRVEDFFGSSGIYSNPTREGVDWERPVSAELIWPDGRAGFQIDAGLRIFGDASRSPGNTGKHSLRLLFKGVYGAAKLVYPLFPDSRVDEFDTLMLRGGYNYKWTHSSSTQQQRAQYMRDEFSRRTTLAMGQLASRGTYVHLYIDGLYWGVFNLVERPDASFAASHLGGDKEDYDAIHGEEPPAAISGDRIFWNRMFSIANAGLSTPAAYERIQEYVDVDNLIDYMILLHYTANVDAPVRIDSTDRPRNFYAARYRGEEGRYRFFPWDSEHTLSETSVDRTELGVTTADDTPARIYGRLRDNEEFRVRFGDHVQRHFFGDGAATPSSSIARWLEIAATIDRGIVGESARWGDYRRSTPYTRDSEWKSEQQRLVGSFFPVRTAIVLDQYRRDGLYPDVSAPLLNRRGGRVPPGFRVTLEAGEGVIYYTTDGVDPRQPGGAIAPSAQVFESTPKQVLLEAGAPCRVLVPQGPDPGPEWREPAFGTAGWIGGITGVGFDRQEDFVPFIGTDVEASLFGKGTSVYIRIPFVLDDPSAVVSLTLRAMYDDGFAAWINGVPIASANAPAVLDWDASAVQSRLDTDVLVFEDFDASAALEALRSGENILAVQAFNASAANIDFLFLPELLAGIPSERDIPIERYTTRIRARVLADGEWSALEEAVFVLDIPPPLRVTEIMYNPPWPPIENPFDQKEFEFIEIQNTCDDPIGLGSVRIRGGISFDFADGEIDTLEPGAFLVVVKNREAFESRYGAGTVRIAGEFEGSLSNGGDRIILEDIEAGSILDFEYSDEWFPSTDGLGYSLHIRRPDAPPDTWGLADSWMPSGWVEGTPGQGEPDQRAGGQIPGDIDQDGLPSIADAVTILMQLFGDEPLPLPCDGESVAEGGNLAVFDIGGDGAVDLADPILLLQYLFVDGPPPALGVDCVPIPGCPEMCATE
ncbi:MAG: CotH kinase family protein [Planctomycetes bacterium]|nr:CotH kinase family protein [Planctomycetota bacterium]